MSGNASLICETASVARGRSSEAASSRIIQSVPYSITTTREFSAAHSLRLYDASHEPIHGHNWRVSVTVSADKLDSIGVVMDFHLLEKLVDEVIRPMHNRSLNDLPEFAATNPTAENVAVHLASSLKLPEKVRLSKVEVWETTNCSATLELD
jgi:6-pyruvoyltetrahydropterin/6-carboxytetrahydropterin synthase